MELSLMGTQHFCPLIGDYVVGQRSSLAPLPNPDDPLICAGIALYIDAPKGRFFEENALT